MLAAARLQKGAFVRAGRAIQQRLQPNPQWTRQMSEEVASVKENSSSVLSSIGTLSTIGGILTLSGLGYCQYAYSVGDVAKYAEKIDKMANSEGAGFVEKSQSEIVDRYLQFREWTEQYVRHYADPSSEKLLPDLPEGLGHVRTLVLDLDDTLVHSDWTRERGWRTFKRPGVDIFLQHMSQRFEIVVYSDQLQSYVDPIIERLDDGRGNIHHRLYRDATQYKDGEHLRDFTKLNRPITHIIYLSANPKSYGLQPSNALPISKWSPSEAPKDRSLLDLMPFLEAIARQGPPDTRVVLENYMMEAANTGEDIPTIYRRRIQEFQQKQSQQTVSKYTGFGRSKA
mmetsp:Transcript_22581/g.31453  ORF Transcript_22581/g.31453 Transcript_22581/m.31453 type:complete len:341 (+) Transcript_22581:109-1131(+)|eukprot:CAMPEP_0196584570 /NCGR_PEP_ID=MMETSP1081-20130531/47600_1 /TAXON_ID=36882 /ORGANISM="Pyramimonas amylifera, Strain CCMP720" /LENGTH=340 /DNA_ID=CAMNT_0041905817 /DNA_START=109 /DNA_END=1131 /DNA_ORIENTATION=+